MRKGEAVFRAATELHNIGVDTTEQFRLADGTPLGEQVRAAWCAIPGQRSGVSWRYLRMLAGLPDVKPDRMVIRFLASAAGVDESRIDADRAVALVRAAAEHFGVDQRALDHEIWEYQTGKSSGHDQVSERDQLADLARSFIGAAFPVLEKFHVIPAPPYHPYVQVGRDYFGPDVNGPELAELDAMLHVVYPERFADPLRFWVRREWLFRQRLRLFSKCWNSDTTPEYSRNRLRTVAASLAATAQHRGARTLKRAFNPVACAFVGSGEAGLGDHVKDAGRASAGKG